MKYPKVDYCAATGSNAIKYILYFGAPYLVKVCWSDLSFPSTHASLGNGTFLIPLLSLVT